MLYRDTQRFAEADKAFSEALSIRRKLAQDNSMPPQVGNFLATVVDHNRTAALPSIAAVFHERREETVYEDVLMPVGYTHDPFCRVAGANQWEYPWHRYYADTDSVWLAIELHPVG